MSIEKKNGKYYCRFQIDGERKHLLCSGAKTKQEAEKMEAAFKYKLQQQQNGIIPREEEKFLLSELFKIYENYTKLNNRNWKKNLGRLNFIKSKWKNKRYAEDIKTNDIEELKQDLINQGRTQITVNRYLEIIGKMFNLGIDNEKITKNPIKKDSKFKKKNYQIRYISDEEWDLLINKTEGIMRDIILVALNTGLRESNILKLQGKNINLDFRFIEILYNKSNKHLKIPMNDVLYNYFKNRELKANDYIFMNTVTNKPYSDRGFRYAWNILKKKLGIENLRFHDLRHSVGTKLAKQGVPVNVIRELLGHSDIKTTMQYIHCANQQLVEAVNLL